MSNTTIENTPNIPNANYENKKERISSVWIIPIIAAIVGSWLVFKTAVQDKAVVTVTFESASGIEAGKTIVKYRDVKVGIVKEVNFSDDLASVIILLEFKGVKQERFTNDTRFWVVKPRISIEGISGLDTLVSGVYIEVDPGHIGEAELKTEFKGLEEPDIQQIGNPGTKYLLTADELGSISRGSPVSYRGINVGSVTRYRLTDNHKNVEIEIFVQAPHDKYIHNQTRFWNVSGFEVNVTTNGIKVDMGSIETLVSGGIAFWTREIGNKNLPQAKEKSLFALYNTKEPKIEEKLSFKAPVKLYFSEGVSGLEVGAPVEFKGLRLGTVSYIGIEEESNQQSNLLAYAIVNIEPDRLPIKNPEQFSNYESHKKNIYKYIENMVANGLRAQLNTRNLLTGHSLIALDYFPHNKKRSIKYVDGVPIMPTVPESLTGILHKVNKILAKIESMPITEISKNLDKSLASIDRLLKSLDASEGGMLGVQINQAIIEITKAARSINSMADYLERHPESLLKGKSSQ